MFDPYKLSARKNPPPDVTGLTFTRYDKKNPEILAWRRKMRKFERLKRQVLELLAGTGWSEADIESWLHTPKAGLRNRTPASYFKKPIGMTTLYNYAKKHLPKSS